LVLSRARPAPTAREALEAALREDADAEEREQRALTEAAERRWRAEREQRRRAVMATWELSKVRALVAAGRLTAEDVAVWREARAELIRRETLLMLLNGGGR
jgi:hypothetical protein